MQHLLLHIPKAEMVETVLPNLHPGSSHLEKTGRLICHDSTKELKVRWLRAGVFHQLTFIAGCSLLSFWFPQCSALSLPEQAILYKEQMEVIRGHRRQRKEQNEGPKMEINIRWKRGNQTAALMLVGRILWGETKVTVLLIMLKPCHFHWLLLRDDYATETITLPLPCWKDMAFTATVFGSQTFNFVMKRLQNGPGWLWESLKGCN